MPALTALFLPFAVSLPAQPAQQAPAEVNGRSCAIALQAASGENTNFDTVLQATYFVMLHARETKGDQSFLARLNALSSELAAEEPEMSGDAASALLPQCDARYPLARSSDAAAALPADPFDRDTLCLAATSLVFGVASAAAQDGETEALAEVQPTVAAYGARLTPERLTERGLDPSAGEALIGAALERSLDLGSPKAVVSACAAQLQN